MYDIGVGWIDHVRSSWFNSGSRTMDTSAVSSCQLAPTSAEYGHVDFSGFFSTLLHVPTFFLTRNPSLGAPTKPARLKPLEAWDFLGRGQTAPPKMAVQFSLRCKRVGTAASAGPEFFIVFPLATKISRVAPRAPVAGYTEMLWLPRAAPAAPAAPGSGGSGGSGHRCVTGVSPVCWVPHLREDEVWSQPSQRGVAERIQGHKPCAHL